MNINQKSWLKVEVNSDFPIQNLPYGIIKLASGKIVAATRIGDVVIDLAALYELGYFNGVKELKNNVFESDTLNAFMALGKRAWANVRAVLTDLFDEVNDLLRENDAHKKQVLFDQNEVVNLLPMAVGDYTDFYSSIEHATNVGIMFRGKDNALMPNWKHLPVGYHGRSSSIVVSGTNIHRPKGQMKPADQDLPSFGASKLMDFELEMAFVTGGQTQLGDSISVDEAEDYIFGMIIFNDLSARDIQAWEYVPLGPFLGKSFGSITSPWIVTLDALDYFRTQSPKQEPEVLPYLKSTGKRSFDINLEVFLQPKGGEENLICESNHKYLYWNISQQLAHQSVNGCNINVGDVYASGTISGPTDKSFGSMLELTWRGSKPITLSDGSERKFINDNDTIVMRAHCQKDGLRIGFGESLCQILPAKE
ncbi:fumarylacetoacetase [Carboxylicivirga sp. N1Y90]|uniref:fumarylacetoacetase n=1 Tax=Carboxylicivirga fragile TaxID=3417571 RepID=UPI003D328B32|nr:fumarylacetoacetase [Marinilabiliaceae bacterium N1Y90]